MSSPNSKKRARQGDGALVVRTYAELESYVTAFAAGHINLLILVGAAGLAKSRTVRRVLGEEICWIEGNATAFRIFVTLYQHRDQLVVIDDVDSLHTDKNGIRLLKCLCQTEPQKQVAWHTSARALEKEKIPREFITSSRVVIISNDWRQVNANVRAVADRGHTLRFEPHALEIHQQTTTWFADNEILDYIGSNLHAIHEPSMRLYYRCAELKSAGLPWRRLVSFPERDPRRSLVLELLADQRYDSQERRAREFVERGAGCRATYYNHLRELRRVANSAQR